MEKHVKPAGHLDLIPPSPTRAETDRMPRRVVRSGRDPLVKPYRGVIKSWRRTEINEMGLKRVIVSQWLDWYTYRVAWSEYPDLWDPAYRASGPDYVAVARRALCAAGTWTALSPDIALQCWGLGCDVELAEYLKRLGLPHEPLDFEPPEDAPKVNFVQPHYFVPRLIHKGRKAKPKTITATRVSVGDIQRLAAGEDVPTPEQLAAWDAEIARKAHHEGRKTIAEMVADRRRNPHNPAPVEPVQRRAPLTVKEDVELIEAQNTLDRLIPDTDPITEHPSEKRITYVPEWLQGLLKRV